MDPLETLMRPLASVLNRNIGEITRAGELCENLDDSAVAIRVKDTSLAVYFEFEKDAVALSGELDREPDVLITGSLLSLARLASRGGRRLHSQRTGRTHRGPRKSAGFPGPAWRPRDPISKKSCRESSATSRRTVLASLRAASNSGHAMPARRWETICANTFKRKAATSLRKTKSKPLQRRSMFCATMSSGWRRALTASGAGTEVANRRTVSRVLGIQRVLVKYGLDDLIKATHLLRPLRYLFVFFPRRRSSDAPLGERIRLALEELGPIFVKFGQAISTRRDLLPRDIADELAKPAGRRATVPRGPGRSHYRGRLRPVCR